MRWFLISALILQAGCYGRFGIEGDASHDSTADTVVDTVADLPPDVTGPCLPMDAAAFGPCAAIVPGVRWDGAHCVALGSGCGCEGTDCSRVYDTVEACVEARRSCYESSCEPTRVHDDACVDCTGEMFLGAFWDGAGCFELHGCACDGEGCGRRFASTYECEAVQAGCDSARCRATGGVWIPADPCGPCGHYDCGMPPYEPCCDAGCDCGPGRRFATGTGCYDDGTCEREVLCEATGGTWHPEDPCGPCGDFHCGEPSMLPCCDPGCDCGPSMNYVPGVGCRPDAACSPDPADLCRASGGTWYPADPCGPCGHYTCGEPSYDDCCDAGCDCGPLRVFDPDAGCVHSDECILRDAGEYCVGSAGSSNCRSGLVCCESCGAWSCPSCMTPCCGDSPMCMEDGCPVPPP